MPTIKRTSRRLPFESKRKKYSNSWSAKREDKKKYECSKWRKYSIKFRGKNRLCEWCNQVIIKVTDADCEHIIPVLFGGSWDDPRNHQALHKKPCHKSKTAQEKKGPLYKWTLNDEGDKIPVRDENNKLILIK